MVHANIDLPRFATHWRQFVGRFSIRAEPPTTFSHLVSLYTESGRHYHGIAHIAECLDLLGETRQQKPEWFSNLAEDAAIELAFWTHDGIYDATKHDNEARSAELALWCADRLGFDNTVARYAAQYVLATDHRRMTDVRGAQIVCDIDLSSLAAPWEVFNENTAKIHNEYSHKSDEEWRSGRKAFFESMLDTQKRPSIYQTAYFRDLYEDRARANMQQGIALLH